MKVLVTGNAGFIGFKVAEKLLQRGESVVGVDNVNDYYDPVLKKARLDELEKTAATSTGSYDFHKGDLADQTVVERVFAEHNIDRVIHLAAQPGVRYSIENPRAYTRSNIEGFLNILESCRHAGTSHLVFASSSSVYGANRKQPYSEHDGVDHPLSLYATTKRANELMAHSYSHVHRLPVTGLRFFTVYGPWGRPDMASFLYVRKILAGEPIQVFNNGNHTRDFTYIDDIVEGVVRTLDNIAQPNPNWNAELPDIASSDAPFRIFNIGNNNPVSLKTFIEAIESALNKKAIKEFLPMQPGDVPDTFADVSELKSAVGYKPTTSIQEGVTRFVEWYCKYHGVKPE